MIAKTKKQLIPAVGYVRMSSGKQEASPAQQRAEIKKLAKREGYKIVRWYEDHGISGDKSRRPEFERMIADAERLGDFSAILCWDQDRFGRFDSIEAGRWIHPLREAGVWLVTVAQGRIDWNTFTSRMMYTIQQEGKHQFLIDLARNSLRGQIEAVKRGDSAAKPAYGYDRLFHDESGKLVRRVPYGEKFTKAQGWKSAFVLSDNAEIRETVRWMFDTFANTDCSLRWLIAELNRRNAPSAPAGGWSDQGVKYMLTNPVYIGTRVFGGRATGKYCQVGPDGVERRDGKGDKRGKAPMTIGDAHKPLVDRETFDQVQHKLRERGKTKTRPRFGGYILSGVLRCGHCGAVLAGDNGGAGDGRHTSRYYRCRKKANGFPDCPSARLRQDAIESYVLDYIYNRLCTSSATKAIEQAIHRQVKAGKGSQNDTRSLRAKVAALGKRIAKGTENLLLAKPEDMEDLSRLLAGWREERAGLQSELEGTAAAKTLPADKARRAVAELDRLRTHLKTGDPMKVRAVVKAMISRIELWWEPHGKRKRLAKGLIVNCEARSTMRSSPAGGWCRSA